MINSQQLQTNVEQEKRILAEQNARQYHEWKARMDEASRVREQQIGVEMNSGFEDRANRLRSEFAASQNQSMQMMKQMQKESLESQAKLTQFMMSQQQQQPPPVEVRQPPGLLSSILTPVGNLVGGLLGKLL